MKALRNFDVGFAPLATFETLIATASPSLPLTSAALWTMPSAPSPSFPWYSHRPLCRRSSYASGKPSPWTMIVTTDASSWTLQLKGKRTCKAVSISRLSPLRRGTQDSPLPREVPVPFVEVSSTQSSGLGSLSLESLYRKAAWWPDIPRCGKTTSQSAARPNASASPKERANWRGGSELRAMLMTTFEAALPSSFIPILQVSNPRR
mmetsp:Transcript_74028/g.130821  ORF Transcript_74028/g.130821 Transcript_74028/m.130821 type:complete len:206 (-) Transcript_74028:52-669(-)